MSFSLWMWVLDPCSCIDINGFCCFGFGLDLMVHAIKLSLTWRAVGFAIRLRGETLWFSLSWCFCWLILFRWRARIQGFSPISGEIPICGDKRVLERILQGEICFWAQFLIGSAIVFTAVLDYYWRIDRAFILASWFFSESLYFLSRVVSALLLLLLFRR